MDNKEVLIDLFRQLIDLMRQISSMDAQAILRRRRLSARGVWLNESIGATETFI